MLEDRRLACPSIREGSRNGFQVVHKHHPTRFADAGKDFGNNASEYQRTARY